ncbi:MAG TPA: heparan-alpha-glucosaminide N-acetyltransferase [Miltoncostaea sp.]|jgi:uncharacterized membrane protein|nr:heparan-alpha-glucosaminide N-acetyltransferase [Miltoncostaea sp.]
MSAEPAPGRLWEVDAVRTAAILMMVAYHAAWDVFQLAPTVKVDPFDGGWRALQVACGSTFLFVVGVSLAISNARGRARGLDGWALYRRHLRRAAQVAAAAALVTLVTLVVLGDDYVRFGILHCIAAAMVLGPLMLRLRWWNLPLAAVVIAVGVMLETGPRSNVPGLFLLGVPPEHGTVDWYPLLPWLGPMMIGLAVGAALYPGGRRGRWGDRLPEPSFARALGAPGRHALPIYLVHQPLLIALLAAVLALAGVEVGGGIFS